MTTRGDVCAVLNVVRRPEAFCCHVVTLVEECLECFEHDCLIPFWGRVAHCFSYACEVLTCASPHESMHIIQKSHSILWKMIFCHFVAICCTKTKAVCI